MLFKSYFTLTSRAGQHGFRQMERIEQNAPDDIEIFEVEISGFVYIKVAQPYNSLIVEKSSIPALIEALKKYVE